MGEKTCKVPTPTKMVCHMLDRIGYVQDLYGKKYLKTHVEKEIFSVRLSEDIF